MKVKRWVSGWVRPGGQPGGSARGVSRGMSPEGGVSQRGGLARENSWVMTEGGVGQAREIPIRAYVLFILPNMKQPMI